MPLVLGVDSSTQATKVEVRDLDTGRLVASARSAHPPTTPPRSEQPPGAWWDALVAAVHRTGERDVAAVSVAGQQHGMVTLDRDGAVLRPAKLWNDTESADDADRLVRTVGADRWATATGSVPVASFTVTKLAWLRRHEPEVFARIGTVMLPHDWLTLQLCDRAVTDRGDASGTGYWSPAEGRWRPDLLALVDDSLGEGDWLDRLPAVLGPEEPACELSARAREVLGLRDAALVGPGTGDNMAAALGAELRPGRAAVSIGTSGTVYVVSERPTADGSGAVAGFADATGRFLPLVCTLNASGVTDTVSRLLGIGPEELGHLALSSRTERAPGRDPVLLPYLDGERTPNRPDATGMLAGLRSDASREQLARAAFDGVVCSLLDGLAALTRAGVEVLTDRITLLGGGARSPAYRRILADLSGVPVVVPDGEEHVAAGACVQAAAVLSGTGPAEVAAAWGLGEGEVTEPGRVDREGVLEAYAAVRDAAPGVDAARG